MKLSDENRYELLEIFTIEGGDEVSAEMMAKEYNIDINVLHEFSYKCTHKLIRSFLYAGKSSGNEPEGMNPKELEMGMKVEMEHTTKKSIAKKIALDHLTEIPDYYTRLAKMEQEAKNAQ